MKIKDINFNEKNYTFKIIFEDKSYLNVSYDTYEQLNIKKEIDIDESTFNKLIAENEFISCKSAALSLINFKMRSSKEVRDRLYQKGFKNSHIDKTINYLIEKSFLNDQAYAREYFRQLLINKNYSIKKINQKMYEKGIDKDILKDVKDKEFSYEIEESNCLKLASKKSKNIDLQDKKSYEKVYRYLVTNGFSFEIAKKSLNILKGK